MAEETENIKDLWVCVKCGRFGYEKFKAHSTRISETDCCIGRVYRLKSWMRRYMFRMQKRRNRKTGGETNGRQENQATLQ